MTPHSRITAIVIVASGLVPSAAAQAQWYSSVPQQPAPLYPYAVPNNRPYAIQIAPNTYVIQRPDAPSRVRASRVGKPLPVQSADAAKSRRGKVDPALIEELRQRPKVKPATIVTTQVVHEKPIVKETTRYVDDPPRVVERYQVADDKADHANDKRAGDVVDDDDSGSIVIKRKGARKTLGGGDKRVISADAEITILGPDRMSIRLFRKGSKAKAQAD